MKKIAEIWPTYKTSGICGECNFDEGRNNCLDCFYYKQRIYQIKRRVKLCGKECWFCDKKETLQIHHIDKNRNNNKKNNLLMVCSSCHLKLHKTIYSLLEKSIQRKYLNIEKRFTRIKKILI